MLSYLEFINYALCLLRLALAVNLASLFLLGGLAAELSAELCLWLNGSIT